MMHATHTTPPHAGAKPSSPAMGGGEAAPDLFAMLLAANGPPGPGGPAAAFAQGLPGQPAAPTPATPTAAAVALAVGAGTAEEPAGGVAADGCECLIGLGHALLNQAVVQPQPALGGDLLPEASAKLAESSAPAVQDLPVVAEAATVPAPGTGDEAVAMEGAGASIAPTPSADGASRETTATPTPGPDVPLAMSDESSASVADEALVEALERTPRQDSVDNAASVAEAAVAVQQPRAAVVAGGQPDAGRRATVRASVAEAPKAKGAPGSAPPARAEAPPETTNVAEKSQAVDAQAADAAGVDPQAAPARHAAAPNVFAGLPNGASPSAAVPPPGGEGGLMAEAGPSEGTRTGDAGDPQASAPERAQPKPVPPSALAMEVTRALRDGIDRLEVKLRPEELGSVEIALEAAEGGNTKIVLTVERPDTLDLLNRERHLLESLLRDQGLQLDDGVEMGLKHDAPGDDGAPQGDRSGRSGADGGQADPPPAALVPTLAYGAAGHLYNITA